jgi:hypothetical protein
MWKSKAVGLCRRGGAGVLGYLGLQPRAGGTARAVFSVWGSDAKIVDQDHCHYGADGDPGVSCGLSGVPLVPGHRYDVTVERDAQVSTVTTAVWRGYVQDADTAGSPRRQTGAWSVDATRGDLIGRTGGFVEHYRGKGVMDCPDLPYTKGTFHAPVAENATASATTTNTYGTCAGTRSNYHTASTGTHGKDSTVEVGFHHLSK